MTLFANELHGYRNAELNSNLEQQGNEIAANVQRTHFTKHEMDMVLRECCYYKQKWMELQGLNRNLNIGVILIPVLVFICSFIFNTL